MSSQGRTDVEVVGAQRLRMLPGAYEGLLHQVLGALPVAVAQAQQQCEERSAVLALQRGQLVLGGRRPVGDGGVPAVMAVWHRKVAFGTGRGPGSAADGRTRRRTVRRAVGRLDSRRGIASIDPIGRNG